MREHVILMRVKSFSDALLPDLQENFNPIGKKIVDNYNRPFYEWKIRSQQNKDIKNILENAHDTECSIYKVLFCVYVAEWIKYKHEGGQIKWRNIMTDIDGLHNFNTTEAVKSTFQFLDRSDDTIPEQYLYTLARESGFPIRLLTTDKYRRDFKSLLDSKPLNNIPSMYNYPETKQLWREIAHGLMDLKYSQNSEVLEGYNFRYYGIDEDIRNWLQKTQRETQENRVKIGFTLEKTENSGFEIHKEIKAPRKINTDDSIFVDIKVAKHSRSAWWHKSDWEETLKPIHIGNNKDCLEPVYVHIDDKRKSVTESPFGALAGADLTQNVVYFVSTKQPDVYTFSKTGYCNKKPNQDMYALYPANCVVESDTEYTPCDIFDGYKVIPIQGDIKFLDGETQIGGVSDDYKDIEPENRYKGDIFYNPNVQIGTQGYPVYKGVPKVQIDHSAKDFTHYRYDVKSDIIPIDSESAILGRVELFYIADNKCKASLICIIVPTDFHISIRDNKVSPLPDCVNWMDENNSPINAVDGTQKSSSKIKMHLNNKHIPVIIDWVKYENAFYKKSKDSDDVKLANGDTISLWDIHEGAYVKACDSEQEITINDNHITTKKIPHERRFDLYSMIDIIREELLLGYTDGENQQLIKMTIGKGCVYSHIKIDPYHWRISSNSSEYNATVVINNTKQKISESRLQNLQFICFHSNKVVDVPCYVNGHYNLKVIAGMGAGILYVQDIDHIKSAFYANLDCMDIHDNDLKSIIITNRENRVYKIASRYREMIQNPKDYGTDWKYLETLLTAVDEGIPIRDMDAFKAWYKCPDIVPTLYERYLNDTKMQNRIKKVMAKNGFPKLISYVAYKSLYKKIYDNMLDKKVSDIMEEYELSEKNCQVYKLYEIKNDSGLEKDCLNETESLILEMFNRDKILYRLLHNNTGKNHLYDKYLLHNYIRRESNTWSSKLEHEKVYREELQKIINCFSAEHAGQVNDYKEQDFIQCNRLYNYTYDEDQPVYISNTHKYENKKFDFVDRMAYILKMNELKKKSARHE